VDGVLPALALFLLAFLGLVLFFLEALQGLEEGLATFVVEDCAHGDEFPGVFPFVVAGEGVEGVEFEDLDTGVEIPGGVGPAGGAFGWGAETFGGGLSLVEAVGDV